MGRGGHSSFGKVLEDNERQIRFAFDVLQLVIGGVLAVAIGFVALQLQDTANVAAQQQTDIARDQLRAEVAANEPEFVIAENLDANGRFQGGFRVVKASVSADNLTVTAYDHFEMSIEPYPFERSDQDASVEPAPVIALNSVGRFLPRGVPSEDGLVEVEVAETLSFDANFISSRLDKELQARGLAMRSCKKCVVAEVAYDDVLGERRVKTMVINPTRNLVLLTWKHDEACTHPIWASISLKDFEQGRTYAFDELAAECARVYSDLSTV